MAFQLLIVSGEEEGTEYIFTEEARIGRTSENEVHLPREGVSRRHARVFYRGRSFFVEDLGSVNGTLVNGRRIRGESGLRSGDSVTVGPVVFSFRSIDDVGEMLDTHQEVLSEAGVAGLKTRILTPGVSPDRQATRILRGGGARPETQEARDFEDEPTAYRDPRASAALKTALDVTPSRRAPRTLQTQVRFLWRDLSARRRRWVLAGSALLVFVLSAFGVVWMAARRGQDDARSGDEPQTLTNAPLNQSFGLGPGVDWSRPDAKSFVFDLTAATRAVILVHYESRRVESGEVAVVLNGEPQGFLEPDFAEDLERARFITLSPRALETQGRNELTFDNVRNPPAQDPWEISQLRLELVPVPALPDAQLAETAQNYLAQAQRLFEQRAVGVDNLFKSWKSYRLAWAIYESLPERTDEHAIARGQMELALRQLDQRCNRLMLSAYRAFELNRQVEAVQALEEVARHFPTSEHPCHNRAKRKLAQVELQTR